MLLSGKANLLISFFESVETVSKPLKKQEQKGKRLWNRPRRSLWNHENQTMHRIIYCFR